MQCGRLPGLQASSFLNFSRHKRQRVHEDEAPSHQGTPHQSPSQPKLGVVASPGFAGGGSFDTDSSESLASRGLDLLAAAAEWGLIVDAAKKEEEGEQDEDGAEEHEGEAGVWEPEQLSESATTETESDPEAETAPGAWQGRVRGIGIRRARANKEAHVHAAAQQQEGPGVPTFISRGIQSLGPPPWNYELLLDFMGVPHKAAADPRYAAAAQVAHQVACAQAASGQQPFRSHSTASHKAPKKKEKKKSKVNPSSNSRRQMSIRRQMVVSSVTWRSPARPTAQQQQQQQREQQEHHTQQPAQPEHPHTSNNDSRSSDKSSGDVDAASGVAKTRQLNVGVQHTQDKVHPGSGCSCSKEAEMDECMKIVYGDGGARLFGGRVYMPLLFVTHHFKGVEFPTDVFSDIYVDGECIARDHTVRINRAMNKTRSSGIGNHFVTGHQRLLSKYKDVKITCLELLASDRRLGIHVCSQGIWEVPQQQPDQHPQQQQQQQQQPDQQPQQQQQQQQQPDQQPQQQQQQQTDQPPQQQQQPQAQQLQSSAPCVYELPAPLPLPPSALPSSQQSPSQQPSNQQPSLSTSPAFVMPGPGTTAADAVAAAAAASAADAQGAQQSPSNIGMDPSAVLNALFVPGGSSLSSGTWTVNPQQPLGSTAAPHSSLHALSGLGSDLISLAQLPGLGPAAPPAAAHACAIGPCAHAASHVCAMGPFAHAAPPTATHACAMRPCAHAASHACAMGPSAHAAPPTATHARAMGPSAHAASHALAPEHGAHATTQACATQNGEADNIQGSYSISQAPAGTSHVAPGIRAAPVAAPAAGTADNTAPAAPAARTSFEPVPPSAPLIPGPRVNDGRVFIPLQIIHDHYDREDYPLQIRAHVFVNHVLLAKGMEAKMVRYRKSANRANHFCMGLRRVLARFNDVRSHCVEQDEDGCLKISLLAA